MGNPPYNDRTSLVRHGLKKSVCAVDLDLRRRDLDLSFLLPYNKLKADYVCVLHPLSYLIKRANFESLGLFRDNYRLKDGLIISSGEFSATSKTTSFPIFIALYQRTAAGMTYDFIRRQLFKTREGPEFRLDRFEEFGRFAAKYPNQKSQELDRTAAFWGTLRDLNALKWSRTFLEKKDHLRHIPYYLGNCDVLLDQAEFEKNKRPLL